MTADTKELIGLGDLDAVPTTAGAEEDDTDLFEGLCDDGDIAQRYHQEQLQELEACLKSQQLELEALRERLNESEQQAGQLRRERLVLLTNISTLFKTAQREIKWRADELQAARRELYQLRGAAGTPGGGGGRQRGGGGGGGGGGGERAAPGPLGTGRAGGSAKGRGAERGAEGGAGLPPPPDAASGGRNDGGSGGGGGVGLPGQRPMHQRGDRRCHQQQQQQQQGYDGTQDRDRSQPVCTPSTRVCNSGPTSSNPQHGGGGGSGGGGGAESTGGLTRKAGLGGAGSGGGGGGLDGGHDGSRGDRTLRDSSNWRPYGQRRHVDKQLGDGRNEDRRYDDKRYNDRQYDEKRYDDRRYDDKRYDERQAGSTLQRSALVDKAGAGQGRDNGRDGCGGGGSARKRGLSPRPRDHSPRKR